MTRVVAKRLVAFGCLADKAVVTAIMIHAVSHHIINLRAITERVGENHGTDNGIVGYGATGSTRGRGNGFGIVVATAVVRGSRVNGRSTRTGKGIVRHCCFAEERSGSKVMTVVWLQISAVAWSTESECRFLWTC